MNRFVTILPCMLVLFAAHEAQAQLRITLKLDPTSALQFESINAYVSISNDSAEVFSIDEDSQANKAHVLFSVEKRQDEPVRRIDNNPPVMKMTINPGEKQDFITDITLRYDLAAVGRYVVRAVVVVGTTRYESNAVVIDVVRGIEITSVTKSVSGYSDRSRRYVLRYWARNQSEFLFLCVEEDGGRTSYGVFSLGPVIRVAKPVLEVDRAGNITVIHQATRMTFLHSKFEATPDGVFFVDQTYRTADGKPYPFVEDKTSVPQK